MARLTDADRKRLWVLSGNQCAFVGCRQELVETLAAVSDAVVVGEEAHIVAEADEGPRGNPSMPIGQRNSYGNIILLCPTHHTLIDKKEGRHYSVDLLKEMKRNHERMVKHGQSISVRGVTRANMEALANEWARKAELDEWSNWTSWLLGVQPRMERVKRFKLQALAEWLLARYWMDEYPGTAKAMNNFLSVLSDFNRFYFRHSFLQGDVLTIRQYQQEIVGWDQGRYEEALQRFQEETRTVAELVVELTRAANLVCDEVRAEVSDQFRVTQGKVLVQVPAGLGFQVRVPEYSPAERELVHPYPGIREFAEARLSRDFHFPGPAKFEHIEFYLD